MENMKLEATDSRPDGRPQGLRGNPGVAPAVRGSGCTAEEIIRVLGDPRDHVEVKSLQVNRLPGWLGV